MLVLDFFRSTVNIVTVYRPAEHGRVLCGKAGWPQSRNTSFTQDSKSSLE